jgi:hypothetical protein
MPKMSRRKEVSRPEWIYDTIQPPKIICARYTEPTKPALYLVKYPGGQLLWTDLKDIASDIVLEFIKHIKNWSLEEFTVANDLVIMSGIGSGSSSGSNRGLRI